MFPNKSTARVTFLHQTVKMFISALKFDILTWDSMGVDSLLESAPSGRSRNCTELQFLETGFVDLRIMEQTWTSVTWRLKQRSPYPQRQTVRCLLGEGTDGRTGSHSDVVLHFCHIIIQTEPGGRKSETNRQLSIQKRSASERFNTNICCIMRRLKGKTSVRCLNS